MPTRKNITSTISEIKHTIADVKLNDSQKLIAIDDALSEQASKVGQVEQQINAFKENMATIHRGKDYYEPFV